MKQMHGLLQRQLKRYFGDVESVPVQYQGFIDAVNDAYWRSESDRRMLERSLDLSSQELLQANSELRAVFQAVPDLFIRMDADGTILDLNGGTQKNFYRSPEKLLGKRFQDVPDLEAGKKFKDMIEQVKKEKNMVICEYSLKIQNQECFFEARLLPLHETEIIAIIREITSRKKMELELRDSEERLRSIYNAANDAILVIDLESNCIIETNAKASMMLDYSQDELSGMAVSQIHPDEMDLVHQFLHELIAARVAKTDKLTCKTKGDRVIPTEISASIIHIKGKQYMLAIVRDISDRKKAESERKRLEDRIRQSEKMQAIGTLAGGIAHDFNNILWVIMGNAEMTLRKLPQDNPAHGRISEILTASKRARDLIEQILTFSRQKDPQEVRPIEIHPYINEALALLEATLPSSITIRKSIDANCGTVLGDPTRIQQIMMNLGTNAYHAIGERNGIIEVSLKVLSSDRLQTYDELTERDYIELAVSDTGCGMDPATIERIFEPFFTTKNVGEGTGLGLSTVHGIVKSFDGDIKVQSEPGQGSIFRVYLPRVGDKGKTKVEHFRDVENSKGQGHIMVVDDEVQVLTIVKDMLEELNYKVSPLASGKQAFEEFVAKPEQFDLIITDHTMPEITGLEMAEKIQQVRSDIPIILITGFSMEIKANAGKSGIHKCLKKPLVFHELEQAVVDLLTSTEKGEDCAKYG